jgi:hypothetical protein
MQITKGDIVNEAFEEIRISGLTIKATPDEIERGLFKLESLAAELESRNVLAGYNFTEYPDAADDSGLHLSARQAFVTNLATRMVTSFGKEMPSVLAVQALQSLSTLSGSVALLRQVQAPSRMPRGSGNTLRYNRWQRYNVPVEQAPLGSSTKVLRIGNVNDYFAEWDAYLSTGEDLESYVLVASKGVEVLSESLSTPRVNFRLRGEQVSSTNDGLTAIFATVSITVTTTNGRVDTKVINFRLTN